jgi:hypothetical protein
MSEPKHTPLPWKADGPEVFALGADGNFACHVATAWSYPYVGPGSDDAGANAALIVRAVNSHAGLLVACEAALVSASFQEDEANEQGWGHVEIPRRDINRIREAVAKARGA